MINSLILTKLTFRKRGEARQVEEHLEKLCNADEWERILEEEMNIREDELRNPFVNSYRGWDSIKWTKWFANEQAEKGQWIL